MMLASRCLSPVAWLSHALSRAEEPSTRSVIAARGGPRSSTLMSLNSTQSKSSDDTDAARLIFTLDSPSSPLQRRVYLPAQLESGEDRQTTSGERGGI